MSLATKKTVKKITKKMTEATITSNQTCLHMNKIMHYTDLLSFLNLDPLFLNSLLLSPFNVSFLTVLY